MEKMYDKVKEMYNNNDLSLEKYYDENDDPLFKKITSSLKLPKKELMKYTTKFEDTVKELKNCDKCPNLLSCKNEVVGHVYYPENDNGQVVFCYRACKYQKVFEKDEADVTICDQATKDASAGTVMNITIKE